MAFTGLRRTAARPRTIVLLVNSGDGGKIADVARTPNSPDGLRHRQIRPARRPPYETHGSAPRRQTSAGAIDDLAPRSSMREPHTLPIQRARVHRRTEPAVQAVITKIKYPERRACGRPRALCRVQCGSFSQRTAASSGEAHAGRQVLATGPTSNACAASRRAARTSRTLWCRSPGGSSA